MAQKTLAAQSTRAFPIIIPMLLQRIHSRHTCKGATEAELLRAILLPLPANTLQGRIPRQIRILVRHLRQRQTQIPTTTTTTTSVHHLHRQLPPATMIHFPAFRQEGALRRHLLQPITLEHHRHHRHHRQLTLQEATATRFPALLPEEILLHRLRHIPATILERHFRLRHRLLPPLRQGTT
jgi:hypothetical protein